MHELEFCAYYLVVYQHWIFLFGLGLLHLQLFWTVAGSLQPMHFAALPTWHLRTQISARIVKFIERRLVSWWPALHHILHRHHRVVIRCPTAGRMHLLMKIKSEVDQLLLVQPFGITDACQFIKQEDNLCIFDPLGHLNLIAYLLQQFLLTMSLIRRMSHQHLKHNNPNSI